MDKKEIQFEDFLNEVNLLCRGFVEQVHEYFMQNNCKIKIELAKSGYVVSYTHTKTKKVIANFVFRKNALVIRIYGDNVHKYNDFIETLPEGMLKAIEKSPVCKRLVDPTTCNSRCPKGNEFTVKGTAYQKCRYNSFMFEINEENMPFIMEFLEKETGERSA